MQFATKKRRVPQIVLTSLMDLLCILLIFFMVTTSFKQALPEVQLSLPESKQGKEGEIAKAEPLTLTVDKDDNLWIRDKPVTLAELPKALKAEKAANPNATLELRSDEKVNFGTIIRIMDAAKAAKIENIKALTRSPDDNQDR